MFRFKRVMQVCFVIFFICVSIFVTHAALANHITAFVAAGTGLVIGAIPFVLSAFSRLRRLAPYAFSLCFAADCLLLSLLTGTPVYLPLIMVCGTIAISFFVNPMANVWFTAASNIAIFIALFLTPGEIRRDIPIAVFCMMFALYDFVQITVIVLVYAVRRSTDAMSRRLKRMLTADRRKNLFWETAAKEIGKPIAEINGQCRNLLKSEIDDAARNRAYEIQSSMRNLQAMLDDANDHARLENKNLKIDCQPYIFGSLINDIVNFCSVRLNKANVQFAVDCDPSIPAELIGDRIRIGQVVLCLFTNALKFTEQGTITLKVSSRPAGEGINLRFSVSDTGVGIAPEAIDKIFTVYSGSAARNGLYGTHLGLGNAREIVTLMGGFLFAESTPGKGSVFTLTVPQQVTSALPFAQVENKEKLRVLIFPENPSSKDILQKQCALLGIEADFCSSRREFMLKKDSPEITHLFTDYECWLFDKPIFDMLSQRMQVIVAEKPGTKGAELPRSIKRVFAPLYSAVFASVLNNNITFAGENGYTIAFTAPKANVLVVDDSPVNLKVVSAFLQPYEMTVFTAEGGEEAIKIVHNHHIDLILMDHVMPAPDGIETTRRIREQDEPYFRNIPIVAFTANTQPEMKKLFIDNGLDDFISKPVEFTALDAMLKRWLPPELIVSCRSPKEIPVPELPEANYDGFSPRLGILNIGGNKEAYNEVLETFMNDLEPSRALLEKAIFTRNFSRYAIQAHAIKGAAASIGASQLSEVARQLEIAAKNNETELVTERTPVLLELYEDINRQILKYFADNGIKLKKKADFALVIPQIKAAVKESNAAKSEELLEELLECILTEQQREIVQFVLGAVNNFDFKDAARQLARLEGACL